MNNADFNSQPDGFPLESDATLGFMQSTYLDGIRALAKLSGQDNIILTGLERTGNSVSEGWILKNGDLIFFESGSYLDTYIITTTAVQKANQNGTLVDRYFTKKATFGTGPGQEDFTNLFRVNNIRNIHNSLAYIAKANEGSFVWTILDGCEPVNSGVGGISGGRVLHNGRFLIIQPYALAVSSGSPIYLTELGEWTTVFDNNHLVFNPYSSNRISSKYRNSVLPGGSIILIANNRFPSDQFNGNNGFGEFDGWRVADGTLGTIDLTGISASVTPIQNMFS